VPDESILVINTGSSSLKFGVYKSTGGEVKLWLEGLADGIGHDGGKLELKDAEGRVMRSEDCNLASQGDALDRATQWLSDVSKISPTAIGHRVVHGGPRLTTHQRITPQLLQELKACVHFAPLHIPMAVELIERAERAYPNIPQFACFDTAFHNTIPEVASRFPIPRRLFDEGIRRYGFHGLSYESIVRQLGDGLPSRTVIAHLGSGASLVAVKDGKSVDTSMGLTPTGGIPMATRTGDLDPGVLLYLMRVKEMDADALEQMLNHDSGLKAISAGESDMRKLEAAADSGDQAASLAIDIFCTAIRKQIAAYAAVLGGLDMLIFAGGIGEHSARVRESVCGGLGFLGLSSDQVRVVPSREDFQIARHCHTLSQQEKNPDAKSAK
jgi:acetate kinase